MQTVSLHIHKQTLLTDPRPHRRLHHELLTHLETQIQQRKRERRAKIRTRMHQTPPHLPQLMAASLSQTARAPTRRSHPLSVVARATVHPALCCCYGQRGSCGGGPNAFAVRVYFCRRASEDMCESARGRLKSLHPAENVEKRGTVSAITGSFKLRGSLCFVPLPLISLYLAAFAASANRLCSV